MPPTEPWTPASPRLSRADGFRADDYEKAVHLHLLAAVHQQRGELPQAEALYRRALGIKEQVLGRNHPELATTLNGLAAVRKDRGDYAEARALLARAITAIEHLVQIRPS